MKKLLLLLFFLSSTTYAADLSFPGRFGIRYDRDVENHNVNDIRNGRVAGSLEQGIAINNNTLFAKVNVYNPFYLLIDRDNYYSFGLKHQTKLGLEIGIAKEYVRYSTKDYDRYCVFAGYSTSWNFLGK